MTPAIDAIVSALLLATSNHSITRRKENRERAFIPPSLSPNNPLRSPFHPSPRDENNNEEFKTEAVSRLSIDHNSLIFLRFSTRMGAKQGEMTCSYARNKINRKFITADRSTLVHAEFNVGISIDDAYLSRGEARGIRCKALKGGTKSLDSSLHRSFDPAVLS